MGWLGALAGAGRGLQDYASIMGENRKLAWEQQQSDIAYQRQLNLEDLRKKNNMEVATTQRQWGQEDAAITRAWNQEDQAAAEAREDKTYERRRDQQIQDRRIGFEEQLATARQAMGMELQAKKDFLQYRLDEAGKAGASEEDKRKLTLVTLFPELGEAILTSERSNRLKPEDAARLISESTKLLDMGYREWKDLGDDEQKNFKKKFDIGKNEEAGEIYANNFVYNNLNNNPIYKAMMGDGSQRKTGLSFLDGPQEESPSPETPGAVKRLKPEAMESALKNPDGFMQSAEWEQLTDPAQRKQIEEASVGALERSSRDTQTQSTSTDKPSYESFASRMRNAYGSPIKEDAPENKDLWEAFINSEQVKNVNFASATKRDLSEIWNRFLSWKQSVNAESLKNYNVSGR